MNREAVPGTKNQPAKRNIVLFTSNFKGGLLQYTIQAADVLSQMQHQVSVFMPESAEHLVPGKRAYERHTYQSFKSILPGNRHCTALSDRLLEKKPDLVMFCDDGIMSTQTLAALRGRVKTSLAVHDVVPHPAHFNLYDSIKPAFEKFFRIRALRLADQVVLYSQNSLNMFVRHYGIYAAGAFLMPLCAFIPEVDPQKPPELGLERASGYDLFFGRISKYKGIVNLLRAYNGIQESDRTALVIAGSGAFQPEEAELLDKNPDILRINRFIGDGEMLYLVENAHAVVLPYIEASQSGVIPIAYHFGVPVIIADVEGLKEFVEDGVSGIVCADVKALKQALIRIRDGDLHAALSHGAGAFGEEHLDWTANLSRLIGAVFKEDAMRYVDDES